MSYQNAWMREVVERMKASPGLLRDRVSNNQRHRRVFEAGEFVLWAVQEGVCRDANHGRELGTALMNANLIRRIDWAPLFVDPDSGGSHFLYQLRTLPEEPEDQIADFRTRDQWSYEWGNDRPGRRQQSKESGNVDSQFKLRFQSLCLQWTQESREAMTDWLAQFNLATQPATTKVQRLNTTANSSSPRCGPAASELQASSTSPKCTSAHEESLVEFLKRTANGEVSFGDISKSGDAVEEDTTSGPFQVAWIIEVSPDAFSFFVLHNRI